MFMFSPLSHYMKIPGKKDSKSPWKGTLAQQHPDGSLAANEQLMSRWLLNYTPQSMFTNQVTFSVAATVNVEFFQGCNYELCWFDAPYPNHIN